MVKDAKKELSLESSLAQDGMLLALVKERVTHGKTVQLVPARGLSDVDVEVCSWVEGGG